ncbi:sialidase family protein [Mucilaginibacter ginkgonis]|uniref:exo-alpha-sialidase n=1 Tax=Mucilaginibacter ginkgonis TaxID=2682091 RepID=A0A6I4HWA0_9SPHI|nr:sialidase family protein [Mucilaginibacter ginkgonis]QQL50141.1 exo-alpha-sialidase [Mucilaginibacter ginkgonis]
MKKTALKVLQASFIMGCLVIVMGCKKSPLNSATSENVSVNNPVKGTNAVTTTSSDPTYQRIFVGGTGGYHSYRIPSIIKTTAGTLIAFAEGRVSSNEDYGNIDIVFKRSTDNGATWGSMGVAVGTGTSTFAQGTCGNPTAVVDQSNGKIWLFMSWNDFGKNQNGDDGKTKIGVGDRPVYMLYSTNDGVSWSTPVNMTATLQPAGTAFDAMGPGIGIQTTINNAGRLIIPATSRNIYSDDHGDTWSYASTPGGTSESTIVELANGSFYRNDRPTLSNWNAHKRRWISTGQSLTSFAPFTFADDSLLDPRMEGSMLRYNLSEPKRILFLNSASTVTRLNMRIRISYDEGQSWQISRRVYDYLTTTQEHDQGKGGYSSMVKTADLRIGALIENNDAVGDDTGHQSIEFVKFGLAWVINGQTEP